MRHRKNRLVQEQPSEDASDESRKTSPKVPKGRGWVQVFQLLLLTVVFYSMLKAFQWGGSRLRSSTSLLRSLTPARPAFYKKAGLPTTFRELGALAFQSKPQTPISQPTSMTTPQSVGNFDLVKQVDVSYTPVRVSKWRSRVTGLSVVHIDYEGDNALICLFA
jgi:hypothetical protein